MCKKNSHLVFLQTFSAFNIFHENLQEIVFSLFDFFKAFAQGFLFSFISQYTHKAPFSENQQIFGTLFYTSNPSRWTLRQCLRWRTKETLTGWTPATGSVGAWLLNYMGSNKAMRTRECQPFLSTFSVVIN